MTKEELRIMIKSLHSTIEERFAVAEQKMKKVDECLGTDEYEEANADLLNYWKESKIYYQLHNKLVEELKRQ